MIQMLGREIVLTILNLKIDCLAQLIQEKQCSKGIYSGYGITFDGARSWSFDKGFARNVVIFGFGDNSLSHADNCKNTFLVLGEGLTDGINGNLDSVEKKFIINFSKADKKVLLGFQL